MSLNALWKLLSVLSAVLKLVPFCRFRSMRRVITADKISVGFQYLNESNREEGVIRYNMQEGYFVVFTWPSSFSALRKVQELMRLLSFALKIIRSESCR